LIAGGTVKIANSRFTSIKNDYCLTFDRNAEIVEVPEDEAIPTQGYNLFTINEIQSNDRLKTIDIIAVVHSIGQT